ncbi:hypothetical protein CBS14141_004261 [Malassezia furfur]|nr:hypothetical protein CBS14141_004261 [Malassezia furfur]
MAGGHHRSVKIDPAIERWQAMHNSMYQRFRWTPKNTPSLLFFGIAVPAATLYLFTQTNSKWDWSGKTKDESLLAQPPKPAEEQ